MRENKIIAERITKKCVFEEIDEKLSPIKTVISHEIKEITDDHKEIYSFFKYSMKGGEISQEFFGSFFKDLD